MINRPVIYRLDREHACSPRSASLSGSLAIFTNKSKINIFKVAKVISLFDYCQTKSIDQVKGDYFRSYSIETRHHNTRLLGISISRMVEFCFLIGLLNKQWYNYWLTGPVRRELFDVILNIEYIIYEKKDYINSRISMLNTPFCWLIALYWGFEYKINDQRLVLLGTNRHYRAPELARTRLWAQVVTRLRGSAPFGFLISQMVMKIES